MYLQPEPLLAMGPYVRPAYAYALNNPIYLSDPTGLDVCWHRSGQGFHHEWISFDKDPARTYGGWPGNNPFGGEMKIFHPDPRGKESSAPETTTECKKTTPQEDNKLEALIQSSWKINGQGPGRNIPYFFGAYDCRSFVSWVQVQAGVLPKYWWAP